MSRKEDLQARADGMGLDTSGTAAELEQRIIEREQVVGSQEPDPTDSDTEGSSVVREVLEEDKERLSGEAEAALAAVKESGSEEDTLNVTRLTSTRGDESAAKNPLGLATSRETGYIGVDPIYQNSANESHKPYLGEEGSERRAAEDKAFDDAESLAAQSVGVGRLGYRDSRPRVDQEG